MCQLSHGRCGGELTGGPVGGEGKVTGAGELSVFSKCHNATFVRRLTQTDLVEFHSVQSKIS